MVKEKHICKSCGVEFIPKYKCNVNKFCSIQCYWDSKKKKEERICVECGVAYMALPSKKGGFCSRECFYKNIGKNSVDVPCMTCGKIVHKWKSEIYPSGNIYCSRECATEAIKKPGWREIYLNSLRYKMNRRIRRAIRRSLNKGKEGGKWESLVGYTAVQLVKHIESQFKDGMTWSLFFEGKIHIDHKIPVSKHNFEKPEDEDFKRCWALNNLQPLWAIDNIVKNNSIDKPFQPSLVFG